MIGKLLIILIVLIAVFLIICILALCKAASIQSRREEADRPSCYTPNDNPYPLCVGNGSEECKYCCIYGNMPEPPFD